MSQREVITAGDAPAAAGAYSHAMATGSLVFTAGQIALDPATGELVPGDAAAQAQRVLDNLDAVLRAAGASLETVLKATIYLADMADFNAVNEVYASRMPQPYPARTTIAVKAIPRGALVEIECVAARSVG
jgi:2-iminobutanoate/2-iminopropanoate deaminase